MIRHCVFLHFRDGTSDEVKAALYADIAVLTETISGMLSFHAGPNCSPEGHSKGFEDGFIVDFSSVEARDRYLAHPEHQRAGTALVEALEGGLQGLLVFDIGL